jgi:hypothetical protein
LAGELLVITFMGLVAAAAHRTGVTLLLFPELAALSHDVLTCAKPSTECENL